MPASREAYKLGVDVVDPAPSGAGGDLIQDNIKRLADLIEDLLSQQIDYSIYAPGNDTLVIVLNAKKAFTIIGMSIKTAAGTCTAALKIEGTSITGISAVSVSSTETTATASSSDNVVSEGDTVTLVLSSVSGVTFLDASIEIERATP